MKDTDDRDERCYESNGVRSTREPEEEDLESKDLARMREETKIKLLTSSPVSQFNERNE